MVSKQPTKPTAVELFAGGGGMALGLHEAGFAHQALVEFEAKACETLRRNATTWAGRRLNAEAPWHPDQVLEADVRKVIDGINTPSGGLDLLAGGPPCQPFSLAGVHEGNADSRNMFPAALDYVRYFQPKLVIFENVPGLLRPSFLPYFHYVEEQLRWPTTPAKPGEPWIEHLARLRRRTTGPLETRYRVTRQLINAADVGVAQKRRRVFLMAVRADVADAAPPPLPLTHSQAALEYAQWVEPTYWDEHDMLPPPSNSMTQERRYQLKLDGFPEPKRWQTVRDALRFLPEPVEGVDHPQVLNHIGIPGAKIYKGHTGSLLDQPSKTLKAGVHGVCGGEAMIRYPDDTVRYMSVREAATLQGFPPDYEFVGARSHAMRHIGNAVAMEVARQAGLHLRQHTGI